jgi:hypothetical protein
MEQQVQLSHPLNISAKSIWITYQQVLVHLIRWLQLYLRVQVLSEYSRTKHRASSGDDYLRY